ncbi:MAG: hypothetical protein II956_09900 [Bacteroidales bacterium]|nr:hypothetical protein [Bacteroidales bacterium]
MKTPLIFFSVVVFFLYFQGIDPEKDYRNFGSAKHLKGKTYVLLLFVSLDNSPWETAEITNAVRKTREAFSWIKKEAEKYGANSEFQLYALGNKDDKIFTDYIPQTPFEGSKSNSFVNHALRKAGYSSNFDFVKYASETFQCENFMVIVFCNARGRSYALPQSSLDYALSKEYGYALRPKEGCVVYSSNSKGEELSPVTIAHETLHLFGAADLYEKTNRNTEYNMLVKAYFKNSVMHRTNENLENLEIDSLTAFLTGLNNDYKNRFEYFLKQ